MTPPSSSSMQSRANHFGSSNRLITAQLWAFPRLTLRRIERSCTAPGSAPLCSQGPWRRRAAGLCGRHIGVSSGVWQPSPACTGACTCPAGVRRGGPAGPSWSYPSPPESWGETQQCWSLIGSPHLRFASTSIQETTSSKPSPLKQLHTKITHDMSEIFYFA